MSGQAESQILHPSPFPQKFSNLRKANKRMMMSEF